MLNFVKKKYKITIFLTKNAIWYHYEKQNNNKSNSNNKLYLHRNCVFNMSK